MRKQSFIDRMRLTYKLYLPNVLYLVLIAVVVVMMFMSNSMMKQIGEKTNEFNKTALTIRNSVMSIKDYMGNDISFEQLTKEFNNLKAMVKGGEIEEGVANLWKMLEEYHGIADKNLKIEQEIEELTESSIGQSNGYIKMVSEKLADEKGRAEVSTLQRLVIIGANLNTSSNYELKVRFLKLKEDPTLKASMLEYIDTLISNVETDVKRLSGTPFQGMAESARAANNRIKELTSEYIANVAREAALKEKIFEATETGFKLIDDGRAKVNEVTNKLASQFFTILVIVLLVVSIIGILLSVVFARSISRSLKNTISELTTASDSVSNASGQVSGASQSLAEGASEQAAALEETSSSLEEMASMTRQNSDHANQANTLMSEAKVVVGRAGESMKQMSGAMEEMSGYGQEVSKIIKTIDEIAFQTNLLALNAAVEAARAGEAGQGFAVVADEVRNLAQRAAEAAKNTAALIETTVSKIGEANNLVKQTDEAFTGVVDSSAKVADLVGGIASATGEQAQGIDQINQAVAQMDSVVQNNAASAEESAGATEELNNLAGNLKDIVDQLTQMVGGVSASGAAGSDSYAAAGMKPTRIGAPAAQPERDARPAPTAYLETDMDDF